MKKNLLFLTLILAGCCYSEIYSQPSKEVQAKVDEFQKRAGKAASKEEYDKIKEEYTEFIMENWPMGEHIPPL